MRWRPSTVGSSFDRGSLASSSASSRLRSVSPIMWQAECSKSPSTLDADQPIVRRIGSSTQPTDAPGCSCTKLRMAVKSSWRDLCTAVDIPQSWHQCFLLGPVVQMVVRLEPSLACGLAGYPAVQAACSGALPRSMSHWGLRAGATSDFVPRKQAVIVPSTGSVLKNTRSSHSGAFSVI